jgi:hypothetical protein
LSVAEEFEDGYTKPMISDDSARQLHDRATRGGALSADEREALDSWISAQDQAEANLLSPESVEPSLADLRSQVESALQQADEVTSAIRRLFSENDSLRDENAILRKRLEARAISQPA